MKITSAVVRLGRARDAPALRRAMLVNGVDIMGGRGFVVSSAHDNDVIDRTVEAFSQSLKDLREEGVV